MKIVKNVFLLLVVSLLAACSGNESADSKPTDVDRTENNDTAVKPEIVPDSIPKNNSDTARL